MEGRRDDSAGPPPALVVRPLSTDDIETLRRSVRRSGPDELNGDWDKARTYLALVGLMYDGMLTPSEVAALRWGDLEALADGGGQLTIEAADGTTATAGPLSPETMEALRWLRCGQEPEHPILDLAPEDVPGGIVWICAFAGLPGRYDAHSPRAGAAQAMVDRGARFEEIVAAGRGHAPVMPGQTQMQI